MRRRCERSTVHSPRLSGRRRRSSPPPDCTRCPPWCACVSRPLVIPPIPSYPHPSPRHSTHPLVPAPIPSYPHPPPRHRTHTLVPAPIPSSPHSSPHPLVPADVEEPADLVQADRAHGSHNHHITSHHPHNHNPPRHHGTSARFLPQLLPQFGQLGPGRRAGVRPPQ